MKIVHIITRLILGGAQENTLLTCREQARLGHQVALLAGPETGPEGSLWDWAAGLPIRTVLVPHMVRRIHPYHDVVAYADVLKHLRDERPEVVHTHSSKAGIIGRRAARAVQVPCIVHTIHGLPFDEYHGVLKRWLYRAAERRAAGWSDSTVAVSADMARRAEAAGLAEPGGVQVVYSAIDSAEFAAAEGRREDVRREWGVGPGGFVFLKVARLFHMKGHGAVIEAFARVARQRPEAVLVLAGEGILRSALEAETRRLGIEQRVRFLGLVPRGEVPGILWAADAVVHASLREGLARVLPQAGLCRRPVVTLDIGGAREVVIDGRNGFLLPAPASGAPDFAMSGPLADAMDRLAGDPAAARKMGDAWPRDVLAKFESAAATGQLMRVYERVLSSKRPARPEVSE